jgi:hypothetical protein
VIASFETAAKMGIYAVDGGIEPQMLNQTMKIMVDTGDLAAPLPYDTIVDRRIVQ